MTKTCKRCERTLPLSDFGRHPTAALGVRPECNQCRNTSQRAAYAISGHSDARKESLRAWWRANGDKRRAYARKWREAHPEKVADMRRRVDPETQRAAERRSYRKHSAKRLAKHAAWVEANRHITRTYWSKRRADARQAPGFFTGADVLHMLSAQDGACYYCENGMGEDYTVDHRIPLSRTEMNPSNWPENLCLSCQSCNSKKHNATEWEFRRRMEKEAVA